jgi:hypothetical protein
MEEAKQANKKMYLVICHLQTPRQMFREAEIKVLILTEVTQIFWDSEEEILPRNIA